MLIKKGEIGEIYNIAGEVELSNMRMAELVHSAVKPLNPEIEFISDRPFNDSRYSVSDKKIRQLGWSPGNLVTEDIGTLIDWYKENIHRYLNLPGVTC